jgi:hypothetical protein
MIIHLESNRFTFTLPEGARKLDIAPARGEKAVVFIAGEILEVWHAGKWVEHIRRLIATLDDLEESALESLDERSTHET